MLQLRTRAQYTEGVGPPAGEERVFFELQDAHMETVCPLHDAQSSLNVPLMQLATKEALPVKVCARCCGAASHW